jgi:spoIIIJ-associated protein
MNETIYQGETLEIALSKAAEALGMAPEELEYEVTEKNDGGFWGLDDSFVRLRAWPRPDTDEADGDVADDGATEDEAEVSPPEKDENSEPLPTPPAEEAAGTTTPTDPSALPPADSGAVQSEAERTEPRGFWDARDGADAVDKKDAAGGRQKKKDGPAPDDETDEPLSADAAPASEEPPATGEESVNAETATADEAPPADEARAREALDEAVVAGGNADGDASSEIESLVEKILAGMDFDCTIDVQAEAEVYMAMVGGADKELLLEGNGRPLSALELILNHAFRHRLTERRKIRVDAGDFRSRREDELRDLAFQVAHSAKETESTQETQPLNPYERRLVHLALAEDSEVTTRSRGSGFLTNVQVIPRRSGRGHR